MRRLELPKTTSHHSQTCADLCSFLISQDVDSALLDRVINLIGGTFRCPYYTSVENRCPGSDALGLLISILERGEAEFYHELEGSYSGEGR